jgi:uncharacterized membrane protein
LWCLTIVSFPLLLNNGYTISSVIISLFFSKLCHQIGERSFGLLGLSFPVCSRCLALYAGTFAGILLFPAFGFFCKLTAHLRLLLCTAVGLTMLDVGLDRFKVLPNTFVSRTFTGSLLGLSLGLLLAMASQGMKIPSKGSDRGNEI